MWICTLIPEILLRVPPLPPCECSFEPRIAPISRIHCAFAGIINWYIPFLSISFVLSVVVVFAMKSGISWMIFLLLPMNGYKLRNIQKILWTHFHYANRPHFLCGYEPPPGVAMRQGRVGHTEINVGVELSTSKCGSEHPHRHAGHESERFYGRLAVPVG